MKTTSSVIKICMISLLVILLSVSALAVQDTISILSTEDGNSTLNVSLQVNATMFIERIDSETRLNVTYPGSVFFENESMEVLFKITPLNVQQNNTLQAKFNLSTDINGVSEIYTINVHVIKDEEPGVVETVPHYFLTKLDGDFMINITSDLLPYEGYLNYNIGGVAGEFVNITCPIGSWLSCPKTDLIEADNVSHFKILYNIPLSAPQGERSYLIQFSSGNATLNSTIYFNIADPDLSFKDYEFREDCFVLVNKTKYYLDPKCLEDLENFQMERLSSFWDRIREIENISYECEPEIETKYVVTGEVNDVIWEDYNDCKDDKLTCNNNLGRCQETLSTCQSKYDILNEEISKNESMCQSESYQDAVKLQDEYNDRLRKLNSRWIWQIVTIVLIVLGIIFSKKIRDSMKDGKWKKW